MTTKLYTCPGLADPGNVGSVQFAPDVLAVNSRDEVDLICKTLQDPAAVQHLAAAPIDSICEAAFQLIRGELAPPQLRNTLIRGEWVFQKTMYGMRVLPLQVYQAVSPMTFMLLMGGSLTSLCSLRACGAEARVLASRLHCQLFEEHVDGCVTRFEAAIAAAAAAPTCYDCNKAT